MAMFWEFFKFELKFRFKSISTYVYFLLWFTFNFLNVASESFGPIGGNNGKILLNGPYANIYNDIGVSFFGIIVIAAIFGTSILRDFQRDTIQILFTKPVSKFAYLGGRWSGSFVATVFAFSGLLFGEFFGTLAPWADHSRIAPNHLSWYLQPFFSIVVFQIFFLGSLFFLVAALSRKIFIVYLQGATIFMLYLIGANVFGATRSLEHFWSGILDPVGFLYSDAISRYWTVVERNSQLYSWSIHVSSASPVQPSALGVCGTAFAFCCLEVLSDVGRGTNRCLKRQTSSFSTSARGIRSHSSSQLRCGQAPIRSSDLWTRDHFYATHFAHSIANLEYPARNPLLGPSHSHGGLALSNGYFAGRVAIGMSGRSLILCWGP